MANLIGQWSPTNLAGNSEYVYDSSHGMLWVVTNTILNTNGSTSFMVLSSSDYGLTFTISASYTFSTPSPYFDPALCLDADGNVHFIGTQTNSDGTYSLVKFVYDVNTLALSGPHVGLTNNFIFPDYDLVVLSDGSSVAAVSVPSQPSIAENLYAVSFDTNQASDTPITIDSSPSRSGFTFGSMSLFTDNSDNLELYVNTHPKRINLLDYSLQLVEYTRNGGSWSSASILTKVLCRHVDNRLTVIADGSARYISQGYYTQDLKGLTGNLLLGYRSSGDWTFQTVQGTRTQSLTSPITIVTSDGVLLGYIQKDLSVSGNEGLVNLVDYDPTSGALIPRQDFHLAIHASDLRGTKQVLPVLMNWAFLSQDSSGQAAFHTGFNVPPVVTLELLSAPVRNSWLTLSAVGTVDENLDPIIYTWSIDDPSGQAFISASTEKIVSPTGSTAFLYVPNGVGPQAFDIIVTVVAMDSTHIWKDDWDSNATYQQNDVVSYLGVGYLALRNTSASPTGGDWQRLPGLPTASVTVALAFCPSITFQWPANPIMADRESLVILAPTITNPGGFQLSYAWKQLQGTPMQPLSVLDGPSLSFRASGVSLQGESLVWQISVKDGINEAIIGTVTVEIPAAVSAAPDTLLLARSIWTTNGTTPAPISLRNTDQTWTALIPSPCLRTNFSRLHYFSTNGKQRRVIISPGSVLVYGEDNPHILLRRCYPFAGEEVVDAVQTDLDDTVLLSDQGNLLFYRDCPLINSDTPLASIDLKTITSIQGFNRIYRTNSHAGVRVFAISSPNGCLLLQIKSLDFTLQGTVEITQENGLLFGGENVQWVRMNRVESLSSGEVFIGTLGENGDSFETLISLNSKQILASLNASLLRNKIVTTGEVIASEDSYSGKPIPPVLTATSNVTTASLSWTQVRQDIISGYNVYVSENGNLYTLVQQISSGAATFTTVPVQVGSTYAFKVQSTAKEGISDFSNVVTVTPLLNVTPEEIIYFAGATVVSLVTLQPYEACLIKGTSVVSSLIPLDLVSLRGATVVSGLTVTQVEQAQLSGIGVVSLLDVVQYDELKLLGANLVSGLTVAQKEWVKLLGIQAVSSVSLQDTENISLSGIQIVSKLSITQVEQASLLGAQVVSAL